MMKQTAAVDAAAARLPRLARAPGRWKHLACSESARRSRSRSRRCCFGPGRFWFWVFGGANGGYLDVGKGGPRLVVQRMLSMNLAFIGLNLAVIALAVFAVRSWRADLDVWLWLLSAIIGVSSGTRFFGHYYWQLLPPLCLLAARGSMALSERWTRDRHRRRRADRGRGRDRGDRVSHRRPEQRLPGARRLRQGEHHRPTSDLRLGPRTIGVLGRRPAAGVAHHHDRLPDRAHGGAAARVRRHGQGVPGIWDEVMADLERPPAGGRSSTPNPTTRRSRPTTRSATTPRCRSSSTSTTTWSSVIGNTSVYELETP